jgi:hypothetical protein
LSGNITKKNGIAPIQNNEPYIFRLIDTVMLYLIGELRFKTLKRRRGVILSSFTSTITLILFDQTQPLLDSACRHRLSTTPLCTPVKPTTSVREGSQRARITAPE